MMRRLLFSLVLMLCSVAVVRAERDLYNPLAVGMRWDVDVEVTIPGGQKTQGTVVREITGTKKVELYTYFVVETSFTGLPNMKDFTMYRRKSAQGVYAISAIDKTQQENLEIALPLEVGQTWKTIRGMMVIVSTVEAREPVKIGDQTYQDCVKISYKSSDGKLSGVYWQAPDVGNVQEQTSVGGSVYKFTLKKFSGLK
jgi:hypothetical protein